MHVAQIWKHPVKSMIGMSVTHADLRATGMVGDRAWAVRDDERGGIRGAKKIGELMQLSAAYLDDSSSDATSSDATSSRAVSIRLPDGSTCTSGDTDVHDRLSAALAHRVTLMPLRPADDLDHYRRGAPDSDDVMTELRDMFGREIDEPLPDFSIFPPEIMEFESPPGTYLDAFPLLIMSTSALRALGEAVPDSAIDVRRFRPNIVIDTGDERGHPEFGWTGRRLRIGSVEVDVVGPCPRCVMVTREVSPELPADRRVLRHIVRDLDQNVGIYATVRSDGAISVGDRVALSPT